MLQLSRLAGTVRTALTLSALLACGLPAKAAVTQNALVSNGISVNAITTNALKRAALFETKADAVDRREHALGAEEAATQGKSDANVLGPQKHRRADPGMGAPARQAL